jgi:recombinational DNA repair protein RecR
MKIEETDKCNVCTDKKENGEQIFLHCIKFATIREKKYSFDGKFSSLMELFSSENCTYFEEVCKFLKEIKMDI